jgi:hypothetical protein
MKTVYLIAVPPLIAATFSFSAIASPAATDDFESALDAAVVRDSTLRTALAALDKSEEEMREQLAEDLTDLNKSRLTAMEQALVRASSKRDTETAANLALVIKELKDQSSPEAISVAAGISASTTGHWEFNYKGQTRRFHLAEDGSFQGQYAVSGRDFAGTWERKGKNLILNLPDGKERFAIISVSDGKAAKLRQHNGYEMSGRQIE